MSWVEFYERRAGVLLHPTSLPSGVLDGDVEVWLDYLHGAGFTVWQVLPLGEPQGGLSPYQCISAFAMNPALLPEYPPIEHDSPDFIDFCVDNREWLFDYSLFKVLKHLHADAPWFEWPERWKYRRQHAMHDAYDIYADEIATYNWQQYLLHSRWLEIKNKADRLNISLFGDMPLFVGHDSADVWSHPERFLLDEKGHMQVVTGVPPDYYSETGQRWGNPHYDWETMRRANYDWWLLRINHLLCQFDLLRIDHFRGLEASWVINPACDTAVDGHWEKMPGDELLTLINQDIGHLPIVAEDLGIITDEVTALRKKHHLPGMSVLQFGFDGHDDNPHKPHNIETDRVVYTGTHDNDTSVGWFNSLSDPAKSLVLSTLEIDDVEDPVDNVVDRLIDVAMRSQASLCMIPLQDILHLGSDCRMNIPGTAEGNWEWSFRWDQLTGDIKSKFNVLIGESRRVVQHD